MCAPSHLCFWGIQHSFVWFLERLGWPADWMLAALKQKRCFMRLPALHTLSGMWKTSCVLPGTYCLIHNPDPARCLAGIVKVQLKCTRDDLWARCSLSTGSRKTHLFYFFLFLHEQTWGLSDWEPINADVYFYRTSFQSRDGVGALNLRGWDGAIPYMFIWQYRKKGYHVLVNISD